MYRKCFNNLLGEPVHTHHAQLLLSGNQYPRSCCSTLCSWFRNLSRRFTWNSYHAPRNISCLREHWKPDSYLRFCATTLACWCSRQGKHMPTSGQCALNSSRVESNINTAKDWTINVDKTFDSSYAVSSCCIVKCQQTAITNNDTHMWWNTFDCCVKPKCSPATQHLVLPKHHMCDWWRHQSQGCM